MRNQRGQSRLPGLRSADSVAKNNVINPHGVASSLGAAVRPTAALSRLLGVYGQFISQQSDRAECQLGKCLNSKDLIDV
jgi:hypothetical protein